MGKLNGKIAVITGGHSGIGLATAKKFVEEGAHVFIFGRRFEELERAKSLIGRNVTPVQGDVTKLDDIDRLYDTVKSQKRVLDIVVASAGVHESALFEQVTPEQFDRVFDINVRGLFFSVQRSLPLLQTGGSIVVLASVAQLKGFQENSIYGASKAAVRQFARSWAAELVGKKIRVNSISPGPIDTPMFSKDIKNKAGEVDLKAKFTEYVPLHRLGTAEEIASGILYLASADSEFCTGIDLVVDGGISQL
jgi:NAD(P)-dependent dehydrogenase (short-subunit alcohol dehydrogenase family)